MGEGAVLAIREFQDAAHHHFLDEMKQISLQAYVSMMCYYVVREEKRKH